jgi:Zn-dependent peptidase ImmA (M78 family)
LDVERLRALQRDYERLQPSDGSKQAVYAFAEKCAENAHLGPGDDLFRLVEVNGGKVHCLDLSDFESLDGSIFIHDRNNFEIILPAHTGPLRDRFTIAHELGHLLLHKPSERSWAARKGPGGRLEWEANWFAAGFLMPCKAVEEQINDGAKAVDLAAHFGVSLAAAEIRYDNVRGGSG